MSMNRAVHLSYPEHVDLGLLWREGIEVLLDASDQIPGVGVREILSKRIGAEVLALQQIENVALTFKFAAGGAHGKVQA